MSELADALAKRTDAGSTWRSEVLDAAVDAGRLLSLLTSGAVRTVHDHIQDLLTELVVTREPAATVTPGELAARAKTLCAGREGPEIGRWVWYPWSGRLVHLLPPEAFHELRTNRNRYKISPAEQAVLHDKAIGIVGLSVGNAAAATLALEGIGGHFRLADFDPLSLSNLNRLRAGVHDVGVNKAVLAARQLLEIDPYLDVTPWTAGISAEELDPFLTGLDLLIEECDDLYVKVAIRERARALGIPVIMDTSDRGLLDIERFDLERDRPVLHGLIGDVQAASLRGLPTKEKIPLVLAILGGRQISTRLAASLPEVQHSIATWPQLASDVTLGGALAADTARRILLGQLKASGRHRVDLDTLIRDENAVLAKPAAPPRSVEVAPEALGPPLLPPRPARHAVSADAIRWLVAHAVLAPSAHNAQPWHFVARRQRLELRRVPERELPSLDFDHGATWLAFGAALENLVLAARAIGLTPVISTFPDRSDERLVAVVELVRGTVDEDPLVSWIQRRVTNRRRGARVALTAAERAALIAAAAERGGELHLIESAAGLDEIGALIGAGDRLSLLDRAMHSETMAGFRWTRSEVEAHRDGLDLATLELEPSERAAFELLADWPTMELLGQIGGGRALEDASRRAVASAAAVALVCHPKGYLEGGRAVQRMWLTAASCGLWLQPLTALPYLFARVEHGNGAGLSAAQVTRLRALRERYRRLLPDAAGTEVLLARVAHAAPPTARALRRRLDDVLELAP